MKRLTLALLVMTVGLLTGCTHQTYLFFDDTGCAYAVQRDSDGQTYLHWDINGAYSATVSRVPMQDRPACKRHNRSTPSDELMVP